ncbi:type IV secretory system conjugative DNA transfer family protein [Thermoactinomyces sp. FSL K6-2592]|uniref:VirD4-like conjugal transfer protein, CD1115 family n=1 Tax=Thermoactinomyces sp. FSL K6-2592 TaxID=2975347 RepID=UPI0030F76BE9
MGHSKLNMRPVIGTVLLTLLGVCLIELLLAGVIVTFPELWKVFKVIFNHPFEVLQEAMQHPIFRSLQLGVLALAGWMGYYLFRQLRGETYQKAARYGAYGTSDEAKPEEILDNVQFCKRTWNKSPSQNLENPHGLIFGLLKNGIKEQPLILPEDTKIPNRNVFVVGPPGSAKTQGYVLTNILHERERSIVVTDPKGELYELSSQIKRQQGYEVHLVNFKEMRYSDRYNPIEYLEKEIDAEQVATTVVMNSQQGNKSEMDFWTRAEVALLKTLLLYVKYECPDDPTMAKVKEILTRHGETPEKMDAFFDRLDPDHPAYRAYEIVRMAQDKTRASIFISLGITLSKFDSTDVRWFTQTNDFHFDDIGKKKICLYVILPVADPTWEPLISTFFNQLFQRLYDVADHNFNRLPVPVNLFLDEFPNLGRIPGYEEILATCRSYGISCSTIVQSFGQLIDKYNKEKAEAILANCSLRYLLGVNDKLTAEYFSELIGKTTIQTSSSSVSKNHGNWGSGSTSNSEQYAARNLFTPDELMRMDREQAILLVTGLNPIRLRKIYQFKFFKGILNESNKTSRFDFISSTPQKEEHEEEAFDDQLSDSDDFLDEEIDKEIESIGELVRELESMKFFDDIKPIEKLSEGEGVIA